MQKSMAELIREAKAKKIKETPEEEIPTVLYYEEEEAMTVEEIIRLLEEKNITQIYIPSNILEVSYGQLERRIYTDIDHPLVLQNEDENEYVLKINEEYFIKNRELYIV